MNMKINKPREVICDNDLEKRPRCDHILDDYEKKFHYCPYCGQALLYTKAKESFDMSKFEKAISKGKDWIAEYLINTSLKNVYINNLDLSNLDLRNADFAEVELENVNMKATNLSGVRFEGSELNDVNFECANLSGANCSYISIDDSTTFRDANLSNVTMIDACLMSGCFTGAYMKNSILEKSDFKGAHLEYANLENSNLIDVNFSDANLKNAIMRNTDLSGSHMTNLNLIGADFSGAQGLLDPIEFLKSNFECSSEGYIVYKGFDLYHPRPDKWNLKCGEIISETCNPDRSCLCGSGINVATYPWIKQRLEPKKIYKMLIKYEWLSGVIVPFQTEGEIRTSRAQIIGKV